MSSWAGFVLFYMCWSIVIHDAGVNKVLVFLAFNFKNIEEQTSQFGQYDSKGVTAV